MKRGAWDLSIATRLAIGSALLLLILGSGFAFVLGRQERSATLQQEFAERIAPRQAASYALEESVLSLAIAVRSYMITPEPGRLQRYELEDVRVRNEMDRVAALMAGGPQASELDELRALVERYRRHAEQAAARGGRGEWDSAQELAMREARMAVQSALTLLVSRQQEQTDVALSEMSAAREQVWMALVLMSGSFVAGLFTIAWVTARSITIPVRELVKVASALEAGDWQPALVLAPPADARHAMQPSRDEMSVLARAFGAAAQALERRALHLGADRDVAAATGSTLNKMELATRVLRAVRDHVGADVGAMYWTDVGSDVLESLAQHALHDDLAPVRVGEGLVGQAARDRRTLVVRDIPPDSPFTLRLGVDNLPPNTLVAVPLCVRDTVHGVLLIGALRPLDPEALDFLEGVGGALGIGLQNLTAHEQIERLFFDLRESNQQLQAQSEELQAQNEEIQAQSEEIQVQNEQLHEQAEKLGTQMALLTEADERKNEFLGVLAHELRNPLAPMVTSLYLLRRNQTGTDAARMAQDVIDRQVRHLSRLTDDLLDVTRISRGKIVLQCERLDLVGVVRECVEDQHASLDDKAIRLDLRLPDAPVWVEGDRTRLCQVVSNLLSNAAKFSDHGASITVRLHADTRHAEIEVLDEGCGIDPVLLADIFQPFIQGPSGTTTANGGLGLGLALVKALVEQHDGSVHAFSDGPGKGARFVVRLPRVESPADMPEAVEPVATVSPRRILLIEDNVDAAVTLGAALESQGHTVEMAHRGADGLSRAASFRPDVVVCDLGLPDMDGYTVARRLRADDGLRAARLIAVSGYAAARDRVRATAAGFDLHLAKPVTVESLAATLAADC